MKDSGITFSAKTIAQKRTEGLLEILLTLSISDDDLIKVIIFGDYAR